MTRALLLFAAATLLHPLAYARQSGDRIDRAERFLRAVYACDTAAIDELAAPGVIVTWPIFEELFGVTGFRGVDAVRSFAEGFCERWDEPEVTIESALANTKDVVLVWSFTARRADAGPDGDRQGWGGMTLYRFDEHGLIEFELGEESTPGPFARLKALH